jgi:radical SAM protein with 4Fe4S-binding SPASM domain
VQKYIQIRVATVKGMIKNPAQYSLPHFVSLEITKKCNFKCVYCYASRKSNAEPEMTIDEIRQHFIPQLREINPLTFGWFGGEPLLRFDDVLALAPDMETVPGIRDMCMSTNGYFVTEDKLRDFKRAYKNFPFLLIAISVDSFDPAVFKRVRPPMADALQHAMNAVDVALDLKYYVTVQTVVTKLNIGEIPAIIKYVKKKGWRCKLEMFPMMRSGRGKVGACDDIALSNEQLRELDRYRIKYYGDPILPWDDMPTPIADKTWSKYSGEAFCASSGCSAGNNSLNIDHAGYIYPCTYLDDIVLGNIKDSPTAIVDIWQNNPILQKLRAREIGGKCGTCKHKMVCGGCRTRARMESGDLFGGVESCEGGPEGHPLSKVATKNFVSSTLQFWLFEKFNAIYRHIKNRK